MRCWPARRRLRARRWSVVHQHLIAEPRPITQIRPAVPATIAGVLQRALAKNPADRFSPVAQFGDALRTGAALSSVPTARPLGARWLAIGGAAALVVIAIVAITLFARRDGDASASEAAPSVAVLPFADLSGGSNEYLADGMAETLINALSAVPGLNVAARTSTFSFKGKNQDVRTIGDALGVRAVLEGSVQRAGDKLRITAQLINANDGFHIWSQNFDRNVADVFAVQDEVAKAVVSALQVKLVGGTDTSVVQHGTKSLEAYNAYLQGLFFWNKRTAADLQRAATHFNDAIAADSAFAKAWAGLAATYLLYTPSEYDVKSVPRLQALARAEQAARRALALNERSAEAHAALGNTLVQRGQLAESEQAFRRAIELDSRYPTARQWYAGLLAKKGDLTQALEQMLIAQRLDPLSLVISAEAGEFLNANGRHAEANAIYERMVERYPVTYLTHLYGGLHFLVQRNFDRAPDLVSRLVIDLGADSAAGRRARGGLRDSTTRAATLRWLAETPMLPDVAIAAYRALGEDEAAITAFERAVDGPAYERIYLGHVLAILGPELSARPGTQAAIQRYIGRLRAPA